MLGDGEQGSREAAVAGLSLDLIDRVSTFVRNTCKCTHVACGCSREGAASPSWANSNCITVQPMSVILRMLVRCEGTGQTCSRDQWRGARDNLGLMELCGVVEGGQGCSHVNPAVSSAD